MPDILRVLHCVVKMDRGGYETLLMNLLRELVPQGIYFDFITSFPGCYDQEALSLGSRFFTIPFITQTGPFSYATHLRKILIQQKPLILHCHMDKFSGLPLREADRVGVPVRIAHSHNTKNEGNLFYQMVKNHYGKMIVPHATDFFACSADAAKWAFGTSAPKATILFNGIDLSSLPALPEKGQGIRKELGLEGRFVIGHVGRFTAQKNHEFLLDIFAEVCRLRTDASLLLVGEGPLQANIAEKAGRMGLEDRVCFTGVRKDVPDLLAAMDVFVFPSRHEGLGMGLVEAQAAGLPCVTSSMIPSEAIVSERVCVLPLSASPVRWANAVLYPSFVTPPGADLEEYDIRRVAKGLAEFYQKKWSEASQFRS